MKMEDFAKEIAMAIKAGIKSELAERDKQVFDLRMVVEALKNEVAALKEKAGG